MGWGGGGGEWEVGAGGEGGGGRGEGMRGGNCVERDAGRRLCEKGCRKGNKEASG